MRIVFNPFSMGTGNNMSFRKAIFKEMVTLMKISELELPIQLMI